jgi:hypothetical protein
MAATHRLDPETKKCGGCRYWSEMIARAGAGTTNRAGDTEALCLASGPHAGRYTTKHMTCNAFAEGLAVDDPSAGRF